MKKYVLIMCCVLLLTAGCLESFALIGGGVAGGMTIARLLDQQQKVVQEDIAMMEAQKAELEQELAEATDEIESKRIQEQLDNTETVLMDLRDTDEALTRAKEGQNVKWNDPQSVIPFGAAVLMTAFGIWQRREKRKNRKALTEVVAGGQEFKLVVDDKDVDAIDSFREAMNDKQSPETKKLVAVIKA